MKKTFLVLAAISMLSLHCVKVVAQFGSTAAAVAALVKAGCEIYDRIPDASYAITVVGTDNTVAYTTASSCEQALRYAYDILDSGKAKRVTIVSEYPTVHSSCKNNTYTPSDLKLLRDIMN